MVGRAGVEPTTNGLKVQMLSKLLAVLQQVFSATSKWCVRFQIVCVAASMQNFFKGISMMPVILAPLLFEDR